MTEISEAAKLKACALANDATPPSGSKETYTRPEVDGWSSLTAFARYIQQVSDAAKAMPAVWEDGCRVRYLDPFILPDPVDPLVAVFEAMPVHFTGCAERLRDELAKRGLQIVPVQL